MTHDELPHAHNDKGSGIICDCPKPMIEIRIPMTHDELLAKINWEIECCDWGAPSKQELRWVGIMKALRAVVELHKPKEGVWWISNPNMLACSECKEMMWDEQEPVEYPCPTIQAITKELE